MLKYSYATKDEIPAEHVAFYAEKDGRWILQVEGAVPREKLDEFRDTNRALIKERDELKKRFEGIDPDEAREVLAMRDDLEKGKLKGGKSIEEIIEQRTGKMKDELTKRATEAEAAKARLEADLAQVKITDAVTNAAIKKGLLQTAVDDIAFRAQTAFRLREGKVVAVEMKNGSEVEAYDKDGEPLTIDGYVDGLLTKAPHLFKSSEGGGAGNGSGSAGNGQNQAKNPWKKEHLNMSEQGALIRKDPKQAAALARAAGKPVTWAVP